MSARIWSLVDAVLLLQASTHEHNAVAHIDFDVEATSSGYDAFADLVQMAVREDPSLAHAAPGRLWTVTLIKRWPCLQP